MNTSEGGCQRYRVAEWLQLFDWQHQRLPYLLLHGRTATGTGKSCRGGGEGREGGRLWQPCSSKRTWNKRKIQSSGAVWKSRWPSWAPRPNEPYGFCGRKATLNHAHALVSLSLIMMSTRHPRTLSSTTSTTTSSTINTKIQSSEAVWNSRWLSWAPNNPTSKTEIQTDTESERKSERAHIYTGRHGQTDSALNGEEMSPLVELFHCTASIITPVVI